MSLAIGSFEVSSLQIHVTEKCNLRCKNCFNQNTSQEIGVSSFKRLHDSADRSGFSSITLTGGEPLLHSHFYDLLDAIKLPFSIFTNGLRLRKKSFFNAFSHAIKNKNLKQIQVSLDSIGNNQAYRSVSSSLVLESIKAIKKLDTRCVVATSINGCNIHEIPVLYDTLCSLGVDVWRVCVTFPVSHKGMTGAETLSFDELSAWLHNVFLANHANNNPMKVEVSNYCSSTPPPATTENIRFEAIERHFASKNTCAACSKSLTIKSNGDVKICDALGEMSHGNLASYDWDIGNALSHNSALHNNIIKFDSTKTNRHCLSCKYLLICHGGCLGNSYRWMNALDTPDPIACNLMARSESTFELLGYNRFINTNACPPYHLNSSTELIKREA
jgi:radical SAM protein with 4Fe4S-binding SPASM domain